MAVPNVNQITTTLRMLSDKQLQQYAQMHKGNPYIFPMAIAEDTARKQVRAATQAAQGAQPQPKVADRAIAQMAPQQLPEDVGIGQLRAPNMQFGAEGGIMGYDDGYDEGGMTYGQEPVMMMAGGGHVPRYQGNPRDGSLVRMPYGQPTANMTGEIPGFVAGTPIFQTQPSVDPEEPFFRRLLRERQEAVEAKRVQEARVRAMKGQPLSVEDQARIGKADTTAATNAAAAQDMAQFDAASNLYMTERANKQAAGAAPKVDPTPKVEPTRRAGPAAAVPEQSVTDRYAAMQKAMGLNDTSKVDAERQAVYDAMRTQDKNALEEFEKDVAARGKYGEAKEARLAKREDELGKRKDETTGMALLEAGLAIMSTPGGLATAIGKGAQVGLKTYGAGLKDLRAAQEKMDDARDQIEEFRRNEANMTSKERRQFKNQIGRTETDIKRLGLDAAEKMTGEKRADLRTLFTADQQILTTGMEIKGRKEAAQIAAGPGYERNRLLAASQGNEAKVRSEYGKVQAKVMDILSKDQDYMMAEPAKKQLMQTTALRQALMNNPFLASYASGIGFSSAPTGDVYDLTKD